MFVREALVEDAERCAAILAVVAEEDLIATEPPVDVEARAQGFRELLAPDRSDRLWVLCEDEGEEPVGLLGLHPTAVDGVLMLGTAILEGHRGAGGGRLLMEAGLEWARGAGSVHKIELEVWPDNERAIAYYEALGFEHEGLRRDHYRRRDGSLRSARLMAIAVGS